MRTERPRVCGRSGVTLIEMLAVVAIMAVVLGIGVALLSHTNREMGLRGALGQVSSILRFARVTSLREHAPSVAVLDGERNEVVCVVKRTMGMWHFEDDATTGAFGLRGTIYAGTIVPGKYGRAVYFAQGGHVDLGDLPRFQEDQGLVLEAWVYATRRCEETVVEKGNEYGLRLDAAGVPSAWVGSVRVEGGGHAAPLHQWCRLMVVYDGTSLGLYAHGNVLAVTEGIAVWNETATGLSAGSRALPFWGALDEVRVSALIAAPEQRYHLPQNIQFAFPEAVQVHFDEQGRLDGAFHAEPVLVAIRGGDNVAGIVVGWNGTVRGAMEAELRDVTPGVGEEDDEDSGASEAVNGTGRRTSGSAEGG